MKDFSSLLNKIYYIIFSIIYSCHTIVGPLGVAPAHRDTTATMTKRLSCLPRIKHWWSVTAERGPTKNGHSKAFTWDLF